MNPPILRVWPQRKLFCDAGLLLVMPSKLHERGWEAAKRPTSPLKIIEMYREIKHNRKSQTSEYRERKFALFPLSLSVGLGLLEVLVEETVQKSRSQISLGQGVVGSHAFIPDLSLMKNVENVICGQYCQIPIRRQGARINSIQCRPPPSMTVDFNISPKATNPTPEWSLRTTVFPGADEAFQPIRLDFVNDLLPSESPAAPLINAGGSQSAGRPNPTFEWSHCSQVNILTVFVEQVTTFGLREARYDVVASVETISAINNSLIETLSVEFPFFFLPFFACLRKQSLMCEPDVRVLRNNRKHAKKFQLEPNVGPEGERRGSVDSAKALLPARGHVQPNLSAQEIEGGQRGSRENTTLFPTSSAQRWHLGCISEISCEDSSLRDFWECPCCSSNWVNWCSLPYAVSWTDLV
ncbi:hypothetical protein B0H13DRAFT_1900198 [Mycena leptocephala]|nr:hypothetical protein B0H13DRAFT_1900198 [Mycena leptocephala]